MKIPSYPHILPVLAGLSLLCVLVLSACSTTRGSKRDAPEAVADHSQQRARHGNLVAAGLIVETDDLNEDGAPDQWTYHSQDGVLVRVERDLNFSGQIDMWQHADAEGRIIEEEMDLDLDGKVDVVVFYRNDVIARKLLALGFDGAFTIEKFYDGEGSLLRIERDEDGNGVPNVWEYYENGRRVRVGWDTTNDGSPDTFDQL